MVDFNNEATVGVPAVDIEKVSILQRRYDLIEAIEDYKKRRFAGGDMHLAFVRARLLSLFLEIQSMLQRQLDKKEYGSMEKGCLSDNTKESDIIQLVYKINNVLDKVRLTKIDTHTVYNERSVEEENKIKGF